MLAGICFAIARSIIYDKWTFYEMFRRRRTITKTIDIAILMKVDHDDLIRSMIWGRDYLTPYLTEHATSFIGKGYGQTELSHNLTTDHLTTMGYFTFIYKGKISLDQELWGLRKGGLRSNSRCHQRDMLSM